MRKPNIRLLVTDLDGTIIGHRDDRAIYPEFKALIDDLRRERKVRWIVSTGRSYSSFLSFTRSLERTGIHPDLVVTQHGRVFERHGKSYRFKLAYSARVVAASLLGHVHARRTLKQLHQHLATCVRGTRRVLQLKSRFTLQFSTLESAEDSLRWVKRQIQDVPALKVVLKEREIEVEHIVCRKGYAVRVLSDRLGISRDEVLAIGDSSSDTCMLDRRIAFYTGCPLNADDGTKQIVHAMNGHLSRAFTMAGVIDIIESTLNNRISSEIPPLLEEMPRRRSHRGASNSRSRDRQHMMRSYAMGGAIVAITLVVFANFGVLPFSELIMKPVHLLFRLCDWIWSLLS